MCQSKSCTHNKPASADQPTSPTNPRRLQCVVRATVKLRWTTLNRSFRANTMARALRAADDWVHGFAGHCRGYEINSVTPGAIGPHAGV